MAHHPVPLIPEAYWVRPGQLLAGAHPLRVGEAEDALHQRVRQFLASGITSFVDLTEAHEFGPYLPVFRAIAPAGTGLPAYQRLAIRNWDIPPPRLCAQPGIDPRARAPRHAPTRADCPGGRGAHLLGSTPLHRLT